MRNRAQAKAALAKARKEMEARICECDVPVIHGGSRKRTAECTPAEAAAFYAEKRAANLRDGCKLSNEGPSSMVSEPEKPGECPVPSHKGRRLQIYIRMFLDTTDDKCQCGTCLDCLHRAGKCAPGCGECHHAAYMARLRAAHDAGKCDYSCPHCSGSHRELPRAPPHVDTGPARAATIEVQASRPMLPAPVAACPVCRCPVSTHPVIARTVGDTCQCGRCSVRGHRLLLPSQGARR